VLKGSAVVNAQQIEKGRGALQINKRDQTLLTSKQTFIEKEKTGGKIPGIDAHYVDDDDMLDEELYYLSKITEYNFRKYHYNILITELPDNLKEATCIRLRISNIDVLLGFDIEDPDDIIYPPLYYLLNDFLTTWLELIYYTNKLLNEYLLIHNLTMNINFFQLDRFETVIENGYIVIVPVFEEYI
jgi:hypothetical protein